MYKHILLPVTLADASDLEPVVKNARALLAQGGRITLMHVIEPLPTHVSPYFPPEIEAQSISGVTEKLSDLAGKLEISATAVVQGSVGRSITDWAGDNDVDCIAMASHQPALSDIILGSSAAWVVRHARCSVLVLR